MTLHLLLLLVLSVSTAAGNPALGSERSRVVDQEIEALKVRVVELQRQATIDKVELDRLRQKLAGLEERLDREAQEREAAAARASAPRGISEEAVPPPRQVTVIEVSDLEEPLDEEPVVGAVDSAASVPASGPIVAPLEAPDSDAVADDDPDEPQPTRVDRGAPVIPSGGAQPGSAAPAPPGQITSAAQALYDQGYSFFHQGRYVEGEETFQRFLTEYAATDLGDNARFWIGECRLARNELEPALEAFRATVREYPEGNKTPDALLRAGEVLERMGDVDGARASYREVERRFPESPVKAEATRRLERL